MFRQQDMCEYIFVNLCLTAVETAIKQISAKIYYIPIGHREANYKFM